MLALEKLIEQSELETSKLDEMIHTQASELAFTDFQKLSDKIEELKQLAASSLDKWSLLAEKELQS